MRNQLRAAFYLLSRSAWAKAAVVLPPLCAAFALVGALVNPGAQLTAFSGGLDLAQELVGGMMPALTCLLVVGVSLSDRASGGVRMACCAERGRERFVASRLARAVCVAWAFSVYVLLVRVLLACALGTALPALTGDVVPRVASALLLIAAYATIAQLGSWLVQGIAAVFVLWWLLGLVEFVIWTVVAPYPGDARPLVALRAALVHLLPMISSALVSSGAQLDPLSSFVAPVLWIVLATALSLLLWNRRHV